MMCIRLSNGGWGWGCLVLYQQQNLMRSVSIVYRKKTREQQFRELPQTHNLIKRSVDEYYIKLMEKQKIKEKINHEKNEMLQRVKLKTSRSQRNSDQFNILETLSIAQISLRQQPEEKRDEVKNKEKGLIMRKLDGCKTVLKGLNLPNNFQTFQDEENNQKNQHCKIKNLFRTKPSELKDTIIVLTANFIIDEHYFWQDESIEEQSLKYWKILQNYATIVWICHREETHKKLIRFSKANNLRLDAVYMILPKKSRKNLTISYQMIENDFGIRFHKSNTPLLSKDEKKMIAINGLIVEHTKNLDQGSFFLSVPIIKNYRSVVHYIRIDINDRARLNSVIKVLSQEVPPKPFNILRIMQQSQHLYSKSKFEQECSCKYKYSRSQVNILNRIQQIKGKIMKYLTQSMSLNLNDRITYDDGENSLQFMIGDILRRNYKIFQNYHEYWEEYQQYKEHQKVHNRLLEPINNISPIKRYRNLAYLWQL